MSLTQFDNSIIPVLVGMARVPELVDHRILIRHVVHDLELGHFENAIQTLDNAHTVFELASLMDLKRFIQEQADSIRREVSTPAWKTVVRVINGSTNRWVELTHDAAIPELLHRFRSLVPANANTEKSIGLDAYPAPEAPISVETTAAVSVTESTEQKASTGRVQRHIPAPAHRPKRVNLRAAAITFLIVLIVAALVSLTTH